jgi:putative transposase
MSVELCRYILLNLVRAKMVDTPDELLWSIWVFMVGKKETKDWLAAYELLSLFAEKLSEANALYIHFVNKV